MRNSLISFLRWSERYTKTDMVYLAHGSFWLSIGQIGSLVLSFLLAIIFGHLASPDTYGNYKYILSFASLLTVLSLSGLGTAVSRAAAHGAEGALAQAFRISLRYSILLIGAGLLGSAYYAFVAHNIFVSLGLLIASLSLPLINSFSLYDPFLTGIRDFRRDALYSLSSLVFTMLALAITLAFFSQRAIVLVLVYFVTNLLSDAILYRMTIRRARNDREDPDMLSYGRHLSAMNVIGYIADRIDSIIIFSMLGPAQLAMYSYAIAMPEAIKGFVKSATPLSLPKFAQRSIAEIRETIGVRLVILTAGIAVLVVSYIVAAPILFRLFFPIYVNAIWYSQVYALCIILTGVTPVLTSVLQAHKRTKGLYIATNIGPIVLIIALPLFTAQWGVLGAIGAQFLYRAVMAIAAISQFLVARD